MAPAGQRGGTAHRVGVLPGAGARARSRLRCRGSGDFLHRAAGGLALTRARKPYSRATLVSYESALRLHVLPHIDERRGTSFDELPADVVNGRTLQAMVNAITAEASPALARVADAAASAVLRDLYERGLIEVIPSRPILPPPPPPRGERLTLTQTDALLEAAADDDRTTARSLMAPLIALLVNGGLRISEALAWRGGPGGVDLDEVPPRLDDGSSRHRDRRPEPGPSASTQRRPRRPPIHREHRHPPDGSLVFVNPRARASIATGWSGRGLRRVGRGRAGVPAGFHLLRHTHGSLLADAGQGGHEIAARLGHRDAGFTARTYVHADRNGLADAPAAIDALRERERARALRIREAGDPRAGRGRAP